MFWSLIQNEFWIELQICGAVFRKFVIHSGKFQVNSDWLIKTGFWCWILEWLPNIQLIFLSTDSLQFLILLLPIFYQFLQHYSAKKCFFLCLLTLTMFLCSKYIYNHRISIEWTWLSKKMRGKRLRYLNWIKQNWDWSNLDRVVSQIFK